MALYPRQYANFCLQHCCFELLLVFTFQYSTSTIQHCPCTIQCPYFKFNVVRTCYILIESSMCFNGVKCDMLATQSNIVHYGCPRSWYPVYWICIGYKDCVYNCLEINVWSLLLTFKCCKMLLEDGEARRRRNKRKLVDVWPSNAARCC